MPLSRCTRGNCRRGEMKNEWPTKKKEEARNVGVEKDLAEVVNVISIPSQLFGRLFSPPPLSNQTFPTERSLRNWPTGGWQPSSPAFQSSELGGLVIVCPYLDPYHHNRTLHDNERLTVEHDTYHLGCRRHATSTSGRVVVRVSTRRIGWLGRG